MHICFYLLVEQLGYASLYNHYRNSKSGQNKHLSQPGSTKCITAKLFSWKRDCFYHLSVKPRTFSETCGKGMNSEAQCMRANEQECLLKWPWKWLPEQQELWWENELMLVILICPLCFRPLVLGQSRVWKGWFEGSSRLNHSLSHCLILCNEGDCY